MRFVVDSIFLLRGKLARWFRILGCDIMYDPSESLNNLRGKVDHPDAMVLTRRTSRQEVKHLKKVLSYKVKDVEYDF